MKLYQIRGGNEQDLERNKYNIGIGISLGNKWFTPKNILDQIKWAFQYTQETVVVYIADSIHGINLSVRNRISLEKATKLTVTAGADLIAKIKLESQSLSDEQRQNLKYVTWSELIDESFTKKLKYLRELYEKDRKFSDAIHAIVTEHISKEERKFSDNDIHTFGQYILEELPVCLGRPKLNGMIVDAYTYPYDNGVTRFSEQIQKGEIFPEIKEFVVDTEPKVFLEVR